jgi:hypothetical protein
VGAPPTLVAIGRSPLPAEMAYKPVPKYGGVKGSYTSPFDSGGKTPGDIHLPSSSITVEAFEAKYGSGSGPSRPAPGGVVFRGNIGFDRTASSAHPAQTISFGQMPPVTFEGKGKGLPFAGTKAILTLPKDVSVPGIMLTCFSNIY